jgi:hypothetical protein
MSPCPPPGGRGECRLVLPPEGEENVALSSPRRGELEGGLGCARRLSTPRNLMSSTCVKIL